jgi:hypothetical protein
MKNKKQLEFYKLFHPLAEDNRLTDVEKIVAMYIFTLHSFNQKCFASNKHMANVLNVSSSAVDAAIKKLQYTAYIEDLRDEPSVKHFKICATNIASANYYKFYKVLLKCNLKYSTKFLLTYILSYHNNNRRFYDTNANILKRIGLGKEAVAAAKNELRVQGWLTIMYPRSPRREFHITKDRDPIGELTAIEAKQNTANLRPETSVVEPKTSNTSPEISVVSPESSHNKITNNRIKKENSNNIIYNNINETMVTATQLETFVDLDYNGKYFYIPIEGSVLSNHIQIPFINSTPIKNSSTSVNADQLEDYLDSGLSLDDWVKANISPTASDSTEEPLGGITDNIPTSGSVEGNSTEVAEAEVKTTKVALATDPSRAELLTEIANLNRRYTKQGQSAVEVLKRLKPNDSVSVTDFLMQLYFELGINLDITNIMNIEYHINQGHCSVEVILKALKNIYNENKFHIPKYKDVEVTRTMLEYFQDIYKK